MLLSHGGCEEIHLLLLLHLPVSLHSLLVADAFGFHFRFLDARSFTCPASAYSRDAMSTQHKSS